MYKALQVEFISKKKNANYASKNGMYIKRDKMRIKRIVLDLHDVIAEHCCALCFHILDHSSMGFQLKIKEAFHIQREQPSLNQQLHHVNIKLSF